jgi:hypothetical protein
MPESLTHPNFAHFRFDPVADRLGEGPLSAVYRAKDVKLDRTVALKILRAHVELDPEADERFEREARHTSNLVHPNIATIYEYGEWRASLHRDGVPAGAHARQDHQGAAARRRRDAAHRVAADQRARASSTRAA